MRELWIPFTLVIIMLLFSMYMLGYKHGGEGTREYAERQCLLTGEVKLNGTAFTCDRIEEDEE